MEPLLVNEELKSKFYKTLTNSLLKWKLMSYTNKVFEKKTKIVKIVTTKYSTGNNS